MPDEANLYQPQAHLLSSALPSVYHPDSPFHCLG